MTEEPKHQNPESEKKITLEGEKGWTPRNYKNPSEELLQFNDAIARTIAENRKDTYPPNASEQAYFDAVKGYTTFLRGQTCEYDKNTWKACGFKDGVGIGAGQMSPVEYAKSLPQPTETIPYSSGGRFGCFYSDKTEDPKTIGLHFHNAENDTAEGRESPLDASKLEQRKAELRDVIRDVQSYYPDAENIQCDSALLNHPAFRAFFPPTSEVADTPSDHVRLDTAQLWGQFVTKTGGLHTEKAEVVLNKLKELPPNAPDADIFKIFSTTEGLVPSKRIIVPISELNAYLSK